MVYNGVYKQYLTISDINYLKDKAVLRMITPSEKIASVSEHLIVHTSKNAQLNISNPIDKISDTSYIVTTTTPTETAQILSEIPEVISIISQPKPIPCNYVTSGYVQKRQSPVFDETYQRYIVPTYLSQYGITGSGQVITVLDSPIDWLHTMFYDDYDDGILGLNSMFNKVLSDHRKFSYYNTQHCVGQFVSTSTDTFRSLEMGYDSHGTHVAGSLAGKAYDSKSSISAFNGVAPDAKIAYFGSLSSCNDFFRYPTRIPTTMESVGSYISTNSWVYGFDYYLQGENDYNTLATSDSSILYVFSAGNYGSSNAAYSIGSPSICCNILTVGALDMIKTDKDITIEITTEDNTKIETIEIVSNYQADTFNYIDAKLLLYNADNSQPPNSIYSVAYVDGTSWQRVDTQTVYSFFNKILAVYNQQSVKTMIIYSTNNIMTDLLNAGGITHGSLCLIYCSDSKIKNYIGQNITLKKVTSGVEIKNDSLERASYSSMGPTLKGILKPDVVAPGTSIMSAASQVLATNNHGSDDVPSELHSIVIMQGTSMSTPVVSGSLALIRQYFTDKKYLDTEIQPHSTLIRACIINSAVSNQKTPNNMIGHGSIDLSTLLPVNEDENKEFGLRISETFEIKGKKHYSSKITINNNKKPLKITMSYMDTVISIDSLIPIYNDLDLVVISNTGEIFYGNHKSNNQEEHLTTNEKVIINTDELNIGEYTIHIFSNEVCDTQVSVVVNGPFNHNDVTTNQKYLTFQEDSKCIAKSLGTCDNGVMKCVGPYNGNLCQTELKSLKRGSVDYTIPENGLMYFIVSSNNVKSASIKISTTSGCNLTNYVTIWILETNGMSPLTFTDYDTPIRLTNDSPSYSFDLNLDVTNTYFMIFNNNNKSNEYVIEYNVDYIVEPSEEEEETQISSEHQTKSSIEKSEIEQSGIEKSEIEQSGIEKSEAESRTDTNTNTGAVSPIDQNTSYLSDKGNRNGFSVFGLEETLSIMIIVLIVGVVFVLIVSIIVVSVLSKKNNSVSSFSGP
ncbi:Clan SB, family S8, subtilisin-like serine peptidase [Histomonas meleagridis]|uniref:Clan SB, family S8, subtilisin-like serine peptidase n=1 Tax=Histomonas meleagridis TaxID=135588 RepID=UPI00355AB3A3|nr:Clan SB, family S8, subtilisin-like serine peptidase [Histomonas meleagridis]KAH0804853.1 Clan SB, family S8, subtilisin-like serine peptidase [Histomonas meleagridis]